MTDTHPHFVKPQLIDSAYTYAEYWELIRGLMAQGKTTGTNHSADYLHYTQLNMQRMERQDGQDLIYPELKVQLNDFSRPMTWLVLVEWWCGDVAQNLPALHQMAEAAPAIELRLLLRDENPELMDQYLTDGARSIPILMSIDRSSNEVIGRWGPRPAPAQALLHEFKHNPNGRSKEDFHKELHLWYARDRNETIQQEFAALLKQWQGA